MKNFSLGNYLNTKIPTKSIISKVGVIPWSVSYKWSKLLDDAMKVVKRVFELRLRQQLQTMI